MNRLFVHILACTCLILQQQKNSRISIEKENDSFDRMQFINNKKVSTVQAETKQTDKEKRTTNNSARSGEKFASIFNK